MNLLRNRGFEINIRKHCPVNDEELHMNPDFIFVESPGNAKYLVVVDLEREHNLSREEAKLITYRENQKPSMETILKNTPCFVDRIVKACQTLPKPDPSAKNIKFHFSANELLKHYKNTIDEESSSSTDVVRQYGEAIFWKQYNMMLDLAILMKKANYDMIKRDKIVLRLIEDTDIMASRCFFAMLSDHLKSWGRKTYEAMPELMNENAKTFNFFRSTDEETDCGRLIKTVYRRYMEYVFLPRFAAEFDSIA